jgi:long-subunit acyl-CoA synthetase (AMP-forming)
MEKVFNVLDDRTGYDVSRFTNIVDILQWRTAMYPEEVSYIFSSLSGTNINTKPYTWKKLSYMSATVAAHLVKKGIKQRQKVLVMMPFGIEYIFGIYACLSIGAIPIPIEPVDPQQQPQRVNEFSKQVIEVSKDLVISAILTNAGGDELMRHNTVRASIKLNSGSKYKLPEIINTSKASKHHKTLGKESGFMVKPEWVTSNKSSPAVILIQNTSDGKRVYAYIGHDTILNQCRTQKMTCQMRFERGIVTTGLGTYEGLGFLYALFCGVYVGKLIV